MQVYCIIHAEAVPALDRGGGALILDTSSLPVGKCLATIGVQQVIQARTVLDDRQVWLVKLPISML